MNVIGDSFGCGIVYHLSKPELAEQDRRAAQEAAELEAIEMEGLNHDAADKGED